MVSGEVDGVHRAVELAPAKGAKKAVVLNVSGAFHSALMEDAKAELAEFLDGVTLNDARVPVIANVSARPASAAEELRRNLVDQMTSPVRWVECVRGMQAAGVSAYCECGPGRVLSGLVKRIDRGAVLSNIQDLKSLEGALPGI